MAGAHFLADGEIVGQRQEASGSEQPPLTDDQGAVVERGTSGVLALAEDGAYSYTVRLSYVYDGA